MAVEWANAGTGEPCRISTSSFGGRNAVRVKSIRDIVALYRRKREAKSLGADGIGSARETVGLLQRRPVRGLTIRHIGKEANEIEQVAAGLVAANEVTASYTHRLRDLYFRLIVPPLHAVPEATLAQATGIPRRTINGLRSGRRPDNRTLRPLVPALAKLSVGDPDIDYGNDLSVLAAWRDRPRSPAICPGCGNPPPDGRTYCQPSCRQVAYRRRRASS